MSYGPRSTLSSIAVLLSLAAVLLAGCGGAKPLANSQRKLIAEADPICASASAERAQANARLGGATSLTSPTVLKTIAQTAPAVAAYEREAVTKLRKLEAPASIAGEWNTLLNGLQQLADATARLGIYAKEKNANGAEKLLAGTKATREQLLAIATRDGFANCGRND